MLEKIKERLDALSDAIIAIIMTIMVLEIKAPVTSGDWQTFVHAIGLFFIGFFVVANIWYNRTQLMVKIKKVTLQILVIDLMMHALLCLVPVFMQILLDYEDRHVAVSVYGILIWALNLLLQLITIRSYRLLFQENGSEKKYIMQLLHQRVYRMTLVYVIVIVLANIETTIGVYFYIIGAFWNLLTRSKKEQQHLEWLDEYGLSAYDHLEEKIKERVEKRGK